MPNVQRDALVNQLTNHVQNALEQADTNGDGAVSARERSRLPSDVRGLAERTAQHYLNGRPLPIDAYTRAYRNYVQSAVNRADRDGDGWINDQQLPSTIYRSVAALRASSSTNRTPVAAPRTDLNSEYRQLARQGWDDDNLMTFIKSAQGAGQLNNFARQIISAVRTPKMPTEDHSGARFYEAMAWYTDRTNSQRPDGKLTRPELEKAIDNATNKYLSLALQNPNDVNSRIQTWKNIQKLRLLGAQIDKRERAGQGASYPYRPQAMMSINPNSDFNRTNTIDSPAEFQDKVIRGSYEKPVVVKYGLPYCMHCLLLEQLGSVPAVQDKYGDELDVYKLWWNPKDPAMRAITSVAQQEGVTSSPYFIVYDQGRAVKAGYAFPDEKGNGLEDLLKDVVRTPRS